MPDGDGAMERITVIETGYRDFLDRYTVHAVQLAIFYEESIDMLEYEDAAVRAILHEATDTMLYGEIGYVGVDWHIPSPEDEDCEERIHVFLAEQKTM